MGRPQKYDWVLIRSAYEDGISIVDIVSKYKVSKKTLQNKIGAEKWEVTGNLNADISEFKDSLGKITHKYENDPIKHDIVMEKVITILEDNELISNNRKLLKLAQQILIKNRDNFNHNNVRNLTGAIKDIEQVANPKDAVTNINTQVGVVIPTMEDLYKTGGNNE